MDKVKPILAIETSETICSAALYYSTEKYFVSEINLKHSHSEKLFEIIDREELGEMRSARLQFPEARVHLQDCELEWLRLKELQVEQVFP